jgi:hypothetical protein
MADENVKILSWPDGRALLEHQFDPDRPANVNMAMNLTAKEAVPVCIKVCEPICARSEYVVSIEIFDRPVATIKLAGQTTIFNCRDQEKK